MFEEKIVWHEITTRPLTEEEKAEYAESGYDDYEIPEYILSCESRRTGRKSLSLQAGAFRRTCAWLTATRPGTICTVLKIMATGTV